MEKRIYLDIKSTLHTATKREIKDLKEKKLIKGYSIKKEYNLKDEIIKDIRIYILK